MSKQDSKQHVVCSCAACRRARAVRAGKRIVGHDDPEIKALLAEAGYARMSPAERRGFVAAVVMVEKMFGVRPKRDAALH